VPRPSVVHDGLTDLGETRGEPVNQHEDEEHPHDGRDTCGAGASRQTTPGLHSAPWRHDTGSSRAASRAEAHPPDEHPH
jgi:hypothetical protein